MRRPTGLHEERGVSSSRTRIIRIGKMSHGGAGARSCVKCVGCVNGASFSLPLFVYSFVLFRARPIWGGVVQRIAGFESTLAYECGVA